MTERIYTEQRFVCAGAARESKTGKRLTSFIKEADLKVNGLDEATLMSFGLKQADRFVPGYVYGIPVAEDEQGYSIRSSEARYLGTYEDIEVVNELKAKHAVELDRIATARFAKKAKAEGGLPDSLEALAKVYARTAWSDRAALEQAVIKQLQRAASQYRGRF